jgi:hypothetical protein
MATEYLLFPITIFVTRKILGFYCENLKNDVFWNVTPCTTRHNIPEDVILQL